MKKLNITLFTTIFILVLATVAWAGAVGTLVEFQSGEPAYASEVNSNFDTLKAAINDNDGRITSLMSPVTRTVSFPAASLSFNSTFITEDGWGLLFPASFEGEARLVFRAPPDYSGGDVTFSVFFLTTSSTSGIVSFFIRPTSYDSEDLFADPGDIQSTGVSVSAASTYYQQNFTIPASRLTKAWWALYAVQRGGTGETYPDDARLVSVSFTYNALY
jgi:hypothetical protein